MECRVGCAACCIAPSISSAIPGMASGKPAGARCFQLSDENRCRIYGLRTRPLVCSSLRPCPEMCGNDNDEALRRLALLEELTTPG